MKYLKHRSLAVAAQPGAAQPGAAQPGVLLRSDFPDSPAFLRIYHFHVAHPSGLTWPPFLIRCTTMSKTLLLVVTILLALAIGALAADISGKWVAQVPGRSGQARETTFTFKVD